MSKSIEIEKGFYLPEEFKLNYIIHNECIRYDNETNQNIYKEINTDEVSLSYVNQKGTEFCIDEKYIHKKEIIKNIPQKGFSINKNTYSEADYKSYVDGVTIFDPRGFEFSISIGNFLHLVRNNVIDHGEIVAECILSWSVKGTLVLLTTNSVGYKEALEYTQKQHLKFDAEDLKKGLTYFTKNSKDPIVYLGRFKFNNPDKFTYIEKEMGFSFNPSKQLRHVFYNRKSNKFINIMIGKNIAGILDNETCIDINEILEQFKNSVENKSFKKISFEKATNSNFNEIDNKNKFMVIKKDNFILLEPVIYVDQKRGYETHINFETYILEENKITDSEEYKRNTPVHFSNGKIIGYSEKPIVYENISKEDFDFIYKENKDRQTTYSIIYEKYIHFLLKAGVLSIMNIDFE